MLKVELTQQEADMFKVFRQFQDEWEKLFNPCFTGSLTIHKDKNEAIFEWRKRTKHRIY